MKKVGVLLLGIVAIGIFCRLLFAPTAICSDSYGRDYACMGSCSCEGTSGGEGEQPCSFFCRHAGGDWEWCPSQEATCLPEMP